VRLHQDAVEVEVLSDQKLAFVKERMAEIFGVLLVFEGEHRIDLAEQTAQRLEEEWDAADEARWAAEDDGVEDDQPATEEATGNEEVAAGDDEEKAAGEAELSDGIPQELRAEVLTEAMHQHYRRLLDDPIPSLDDLTPRAAAARPAMRGRLLAWAKDHINNLESRFVEDGLDAGPIIDEFVKALDLWELM
jgi:hypothetical protein